MSAINAIDADTTVALRVRVSGLYAQTAREVDDILDVCGLMRVCVCESCMYVDCACVCVCESCMYVNCVCVCVNMYSCGFLCM